ncbi:Metal ion transporter, partial [Globisporangium splendens]
MIDTHLRILPNALEVGGCHILSEACALLGACLLLQFGALAHLPHDERMHPHEDREEDEDATAPYEQLAAPLLGDSSSSSHNGSVSFSWGKFWAYTGPGWLMSMAYLDPGNLEADLQSGAYTRYDLLYVVLLSTLAGGFYQVLAARLGACTGKHLAQLCRSEYPRSVSLALWIMTELAIIGSDIQEVLGSAIAFKILFNFPLWVGCLLTGLDTFTFLALHRADTKGGNSARYLEMFFMVVISTMCVCFFVDFTVSAPSGLEIFKGVFEPRMKEQNVMQAVATLGSIIMPHNIFLHSALVQARQIDTANIKAVREANYYFSLEAAAALFVSFLINLAVICVFASSFYSSECALLSTSSVSSIAGKDIQTSCVPVYAALISGSPIYDAFSGDVCKFEGDAVIPGRCTPCYVDGHSDAMSMMHPSGADGIPTAGYCQEIGLAEAGEAVREALGGYAKVVWAIGLLASGQASTMTGTYAGQFVMEGFLDIRIDAWKRVALTRGVALIPAVLVAVISQNQQFKSDRFNELLNVLQSVQLPFALIPLLAFTSNAGIMGWSFVNSKCVATALLLGTCLLCGVNYALVYRILQKNLPDDMSTSTLIVLFAIALFYVALLLYLVLFYPSDEMDMDMEETAAADDDAWDDTPTTMKKRGASSVSSTTATSDDDALLPSDRRSLLANEV